MITDCHIHIQPTELFNPGALAAMKRKRPNFDQICEFCRSPKAFLRHLDACGIDRGVLINYVAPEVIGFTPEVNTFIADYVKEDPRRLISCGSLHPRHSTNFMADVDHLLRLGIRMVKVHPPHQLLYPNDYLHGMKELEILYRAAEANGVPVMFHTGTSIFPGARNKFGDPIHVDDVAVDFPRLKIVASHGGGGICETISRMDYAYELQDEAFFLGPYVPMKIKHKPSHYMKKLYMDTVCYNPPAAKMVLDWLGADHVLYGSDAPPLTSLKPRAIKLIRDLDIPEPQREAIFWQNAAKLLKLPIASASKAA